MNSFIIQKVLDGPRNAIFKVDLDLDGSGDYLNPEMLVQLSTLSSMGPTFGPHPQRVSVDIIDWDVQQGLRVNLWWDGAGDAALWKLVGRSIEKAFYYGGIQNNADQPTGNITFTTTSSVTNVPLSATFHIRCVKQR